MDVNLSAPVLAREEIRIDADVQTVWDVLSDIEHWPAWNKAVRSLTLHGSVAPGTSFDVEGRAGDHQVAHRRGRPAPQDRLDGGDPRHQGRRRLQLRGLRGRHAGAPGRVLGGPPGAPVPLAHGAHAAREPARRPALSQGGGGAPGRRRRRGLTPDPSSLLGRELVGRRTA